MALMDKVSEFAKNASDKTAVMFETAKLNSKISAQEKTIAALTMRLGEYFLAQCDAGLVVMEGEAAENLRRNFGLQGDHCRAAGGNFRPCARQGTLTSRKRESSFAQAAARR